jgi:protein gp37
MSRLHGDRDLLTPDCQHFNGTVRCVEGVLTAPIASKKRKPRVWAIWSDFYHQQVPDYFCDNAFEVMSQCPSDYFLIITKRPEIAVEYFTFPVRRVTILPNVIHLVTMENQEMVNKRYPTAAKLAMLGWNVGVLAEPLLSPLNLCLDIWPVLPKLIITGPENGPGKRPFDPQWALSLRDQAEAAGVPFMFKGGLLDGKEYLAVPEI